MIRRLALSCWLALAATLLSTGLLAPSATAAPLRVDLGGGSGLIVGGDFLCTLTTIGYDSAGRLVGITAAHCGGPGSAVVAEAAQQAGPVGSIVRTNAMLDYSVITFDSAKVNPKSTIGPMTISAVNGAATFPNIACKLGRTTGHTCGLVVFNDRPFAETWSLLCVDEGDSGAPVTVGTTLVGMVSAFLVIPCIGPEISIDIDAIINDMNYHSGAGAGFRPVP